MKKQKNKDRCRQEKNTKKEIIIVRIPSRWKQRMNNGDIRPGRLVAWAEYKEV